MIHAPPNFCLFSTKSGMRWRHKNWYNSKFFDNFCYFVYTRCQIVVREGMQRVTSISVTTRKLTRKTEGVGSKPSPPGGRGLSKYNLLSVNNSKHEFAPSRSKQRNTLTLTQMSSADVRFRKNRAGRSSLAAVGQPDWPMWADGRQLPSESLTAAAVAVAQLTGTSGGSWARCVQTAGPTADGCRRPCGQNREETVRPTYYSHETRANNQ